MGCPFVPLGTPDERGRRILICTRCLKKTNPTKAAPSRVIGCRLPPKFRETVQYHFAGWGTRLRFWLKRIGITNERVIWLALKLRIVKPGSDCGCENREMKLNAFGQWVKEKWWRVRMWIAKRAVRIRIVEKP